MPNTQAKEVNLTKRVQTARGMRYCPIVLSPNGRVKPDLVLVNGKPEKHPEGAYYLEWRDKGRRIRLSVGKDPQDAARETEYFWLCESCSAVMTLRLADDGTVATTRLADAIGNRPHVALNSVDRDSRAFLSSVSFLSRSHPKGT